MNESARTPQGVSEHPVGGRCTVDCRHQYVPDQFDDLLKKLNSPEPTVIQLIERLAEAIHHWDVCYEIVLSEASQRFEKRTTEDMLKVACRNEMRLRGYELPEIARWRLREALGGVERHD